MRLIISQGSDVVALVEDYDGPVPRAGEYVIRPKGDHPTPGLADEFMLVKAVSYGIIGREHLAPHFVGAAQPFVEVIV